MAKPVYKKGRETDFRLISKCSLWFRAEQSSVHSSVIPWKSGGPASGVHKTREAAQCCCKLLTGPTTLVSNAIENNRQTSGKIKILLNSKRARPKQKWQTSDSLNYSNDTNATLKPPVSTAERFWSSCW